MTPNNRSRTAWFGMIGEWLWQWKQCFDVWWCHGNPTVLFECSCDAYLFCACVAVLHFTGLVFKVDYNNIYVNVRMIEYLVWYLLDGMISISSVRVHIIGTYSLCSSKYKFATITQHAIGKYSLWLRNGETHASCARSDAKRNVERLGEFACVCLCAWA